MTQTYSLGVDERNMPVGESHPRAKLTVKQVDEIWALRQAGLGYRRIAKQLGIPKSTIVHIVKGRTWQVMPVDWRPAKAKPVVLK